MLTPQSSVPASHHSNELTSSRTSAFGIKHIWPGNAAITVGFPAAYTPSADVLVAAEANGYVAGTPIVTFQITYQNLSKESAKPYIEMAIKGSTFITDATNSIGFPPVQELKPGQSVSWTEAYSVQDPTAILATVGPGFGVEPGIFTNGK